eukprot:gene30-41_t
MHDIDRTTLEFGQEMGYEGEQYEFGQGEWSGEGGLLSEADEMELANELLSVTNEAELEQFLGNFLRKAASVAGSVIKSPVGQAVGGVLKGVAKKALPLAGGAVSQTMDGKVASRKLIGPFTEPNSSSLSVWTQPNSWHHFCCDHVVTFSLVPLAPDKTLLRTSWLVHEDAEQGVDYDPDNLAAVWRATNRQDSHLAKINHQGIAGDGYREGPYSTEEKLVDELDARVRVPGLANFWIPPIRNRIDMLATGIKSPVGIKVAGSDLAAIDETAKRIETV